MARLPPTKETIKKLFALSRNKCAFPGCNHDLVTSNVLIGEVCHIESAEENGPRYNSNMSDEERRMFANLMIFCPTHHKIIDTDLTTYTTEKLTQIKNQHESRTSTTFDLPENLIDQIIQSFSQTQTNTMRDGLQYNTFIGNLTIHDPNVKQRLSSIPIIGQSISDVGHNSGTIREKRLKEFADQLNISSSELITSDIDQTFLKSEDYFDLLSTVLVAAAKTKEKEKMIIYAQILCGVIKKPSLSIDADEYIKQILELNLRDIQVAQILYEQQKSIPDRDAVLFKDKDDFNEVSFAINNSWYDLPQKTNLTWSELSFVFHKLERAGLIAEIAGAYSDYVGGIYTITYGFKKLMELIKINQN